MSSFPERSTFDDDNWRQASIDAARKTGYRDISSFLYYRLSAQKLDRGLEFEDYSPWKNPEAALIDNFFLLKGEEGHLWTEDEQLKTRRIMAAYISVTFPELMEANPTLWTNPSLNIVHRYFEGKPEVTLENDEMLALENILSRTGRVIDSRERSFKKPDVLLSDI